MALSVSRLVDAILAGWRTDPESKFAPGSSLAPASGTPATNIEAAAYYEAKAIIEEIEDNLEPVAGADHAGLTNLSWTVTGHTGTANRMAGFDGAGAAGLVVAGDGLTLSGGNLDLDADVLRDADVGVQVAAFAHNHDASYAPIAKGVTNGDSHDHNGGDGAQISHANLGTLGWSSSGHTGTASRLAGFDGSGNATHYQIGVDVQAYDADLTSIGGLGDGVPCRVAGAWTNKTGGADNQLARWDGTTALQGSVWTVADSTGALSASVASTSITNTDGDLALTAGDGTLTLTGTEGVHIASALTLATDLPVTEGGTGASTADAARSNLGVVAMTMTYGALSSSSSGSPNVIGTVQIPTTGRWLIRGLVRFGGTTTVTFGFRGAPSGGATAANLAVRAFNSGTFVSSIFGLWTTGIAFSPAGTQTLWVDGVVDISATGTFQLVAYESSGSAITFENAHTAIVMERVPGT